LKFSDFLQNLPEVNQPEKKLSFDQRIKWTGLALILYFILSMVPLYGLSPSYVARFETLSILLAANFGSLITLGIGPIVTGSIILQLLVGADIIKIDTNTKEGRSFYQGIQKLFSIFFIVFENMVYVLSGALPPVANTPFYLLVMMGQLEFGGLLIMFLDEVVSKWGIGSGISLFIAAGVGREIFVNAFSPIASPTGYPVGALWQTIIFIGQGFFQSAWLPLVTILSTVMVFAMSIYLQSVKVEIPLSLGRIRGLSMKWPLSFIYTSNIPVILVASLLVSLQVWGSMMYNMGFPILGEFENSNGRQVAVSGLVKYLTAPRITDILFGFNSDVFLSLLAYSIFMIGGSILFSVLWVNIGGQDASTLADQISTYGLSIPGFRRDKRVLESILSRYIMPLAVMGGLSVGILAVVADLFEALSRGTGILLTVMIIYQFYEQIRRQYIQDLPPWLVNFFKG
jgi:preprotein translocase subunit SecY